MTKNISGKYAKPNNRLKQFLARINCFFTRLFHKSNLAPGDICDCRQADGLKDNNIRLTKTQWIAQLGNWSYNLKTREIYCTDEISMTYWE